MGLLNQKLNFWRSAFFALAFCLGKVNKVVGLFATSPRHSLKTVVAVGFTLLSLTRAAHLRDESFNCYLYRDVNTATFKTIYSETNYQITTQLRYQPRKTAPTILANKKTYPLTPLILRQLKNSFKLSLQKSCKSE